MSGAKDDSNEKTMVASDTTLKRELLRSDSAPPVLVVLMGPPGYQGKQWALTDAFVLMNCIGLRTERDGVRSRFFGET